MPTQQLNDKLEALQKELDTISIAVKHIDKAAEVAKSASEISKNIPIILTDLKAIEVKHREELQKGHKEKIDILEKQLQLFLIELKDESVGLSQLFVETKKLESTIFDYFTEIKKINFPERLDKIDNQISAINIGIQNIITRTNNTEQLILKSFEKLESNISVKHNISLTTNKKSSNRILLISTIFFTVIFFLITVVLLKQYKLI